MTRFPHRAFWVLFGLGFLALVPSVRWPPQPVPLLAGTLALAAVVVLGLLAGRLHGLGAAYVDRPAALERATPWWQVLPGAFAFGLGLGGIVVVWLRAGWLPGASTLQARFTQDAAWPLWQRWLVSGTSSVLEELVFRLFVMSACLWLLRRPWLPSSRWPHGAVLWTSIVVAAVAFGLVHLPRWLASDQARGAVVAGVMLVNGAAALPLGWLYARYGIEAVILAHFGADGAVHVVGASLLGRL